MVEALRLAEKAVPLTHEHVVSDVGAGTGLLEGALKAVLFNVDVNLPSLAGVELQAVFGGKRVSRAKEGSQLATEVLKTIARRLASRTEIINGSTVLQIVIERSMARHEEFAGKNVAVVAFGKAAAWDAPLMKTAPPDGCCPIPNSSRIVGHGWNLRRARPII